MVIWKGDVYYITFSTTLCNNSHQTPRLCNFALINDPTIKQLKRTPLTKYTAINLLSKDRKSTSSVISRFHKQPRSERLSASIANYESIAAWNRRRLAQPCRRPWIIHSLIFGSCPRQEIGEPPSSDATRVVPVLGLLRPHGWHSAGSPLMFSSSFRLYGMANRILRQ